jgi:hypothetical protein
LLLILSSARLTTTLFNWLHLFDDYNAIKGFAQIAELAKITQNFGFFSIHMGPAGKILSDGRNAHLIQKPRSWWLSKLSKILMCCTFSHIK